MPDVSSGELADAIRAAARGGIESRADGSIRQRYVFAQDFPGFLGHFPGDPILPAAVQVMAASLLVAAATGLSLLPATIERAKFLSPIRPEVPVEIACRLRPGAAGVWDVEIDAGSRAAATFALELRAPATAA